MKLNSIIDTKDGEFVNQPNSRKHLFSIQQARCQEFWIYLNVLSNKYNFSPPSSSLLSSWSSSSWLSWSFSSSSSWSSSSWWWSSSQQEKEKYQTKYDRMIAAKKAYEDAGGSYD